MAAEPAKLPPQATLDYEPTAFEQLVIRYRNQLIVVAVLAVIGTLTWLGLKLWRDFKHTEAGVAFTRAGTVADLRNVSERYSGEAAAGSAMVQSAEMLADDGNHTEAVNELNRFLKEYPEHPLRDLAELRLADSLLAQNKLQEAEESFTAVANNPRSAFAPIALVRLGDLRWQQNRIEEARQFYKESITKHSGHVLSNTAQARLKQIDVQPPVLVEPPPAPPATGESGNAIEPAPGELPPPVNIPDAPLNAPSLTDDPPAPGSSSLSDDPPSAESPAEGAPPTTPAPEAGGDKSE